MNIKQFLSVHQIADTNAELGSPDSNRFSKLMTLFLEGLAPAVLLVVILVLAASLAAHS